MTAAAPHKDAPTDELSALLGGRPLVLVGMMGAGKTTVGRRLAARLGRHFVDSDEEVEKAAGMSDRGHLRDARRGRFSRRRSAGHRPAAEGATTWCSAPAAAPS